LSISFIRAKKNIFSPGVITSTIWLFLLCLFLVLNHNLPPLSIQFTSSLFIWITLIVLSSNLILSHKFQQRKNIEPSKFVRDVYLILSIIAFPSLIMWIYSTIALGTTGNWALDLRIATVGEDREMTSFSNALSVLWSVSFLLELSCFSKRKWYRVAIPALLCLTLGVFTMARTFIFMLFLMTVVMLYFQKKIRTKQILIGTATMFFVFFTMQTIRNFGDPSAASIGSFVASYLLSGMAAFDTLISASSANFGENVFRIFYAISHSFGLSSIEPIDPILPFIEEPIVTNIYTGMYPFFKDFGHIGIAAGALFYGVLFGWLFKKAQQGSVFYVMCFSYLVVALIAQFAGEMVFTGFAGHVKFIMLLSIPFIATKYKIFKKRA